jgi:hypothetical protein
MCVQKKKASQLDTHWIYPEQPAFRSGAGPELQVADWGALESKAMVHNAPQCHNLGAGLTIGYQFWLRGERRCGHR